ncbi:discoidin domain-containing protein [Actinoplanes regularis]|uniref:RHS repeat-associated core domain-containing protein n=1 Tax=Actinoplanes regularis TaxID=52697 RepID=A0A239IUA2_9ACTN|nr:discoidin domain-containing protein [Actinoplanes regularis]SNS97149.1 RHS repeat-associated core domain-containing protein [Actinoplanes regularis]
MVGQEESYPDPPTVDGAQCVDCPAGTQPQRVEPGAKAAKTAEDAEQPATALQPVAGEEVTGFEEGKSRELVEERTPTSTVFANPDGTKTARQFSERTYARDKTGAMVPIDTRLTRGADRRFRPAAAMDVSFGDVATEDGLATLTLESGIEAGFGVAGAAPVDGAATGSEVHYPEILPGSDLVVTATRDGFKDELIIKSAEAPTRYLFPLRLKGLTPELPEGTCRVNLKDAEGQIRASIPPGFMFDSKPDPKTGTGVRSNDVVYQLLKDGDSWQLEVTLDAEWLRSPQRVYPVTVDPPLALRDTVYQDTFVSSKDFANRDNSSETFLKVGTYNGGSEKAASYLGFYQTQYSLKQRYIVGAALSLYQVWAPTCTNVTMTVYPVTAYWAPWSSNSQKWPGPAYSTDSLGSKAFNRGGSCTSKAMGWETITLDAAELTELLDNNHDWYGFTLRSSSTDNKAEKWFRSAEGAGGAAPFLDLYYSEVAASYSLPSMAFDPAVRPDRAGEIDIRAKNLGVVIWTPTNGYQVTADVYNSANQLSEFKMMKPSSQIDPLEAGTFTLQVRALPAGTYRVVLDLVGPNGLASERGVPTLTFSFKVLPNSPPEILSFHPPNNAQVNTLRPTLWAQYYDPDSAPDVAHYWFEVCNGTYDAPVDCIDTDWITSSTYTVPAGKFAWGKTSFWYVAVYDGTNMTYFEGPYAVTPVVAQPPVTSHLATASENAAVPGVNPQVGNYSSSVVDASVPVPGPPLEIRRTYNSQDYRNSGPNRNLALGRAVSGSAACAGTQTPAEAVNGNVADKWCSSAASPYLQVDLGAPRTMSSFVVRHAGAGGESGQLNTKDFNIQISLDGTQWKAIATVRGNTANVTTSTINAMAARYVKLNITTPTQGSDTAARIYEFEVNGYTDNNIALDRAASGSTACTSTDTPAQAVNGNAADKWCSSAASPYLQVDLGAPRTLSSFVVRHAGAGGESDQLNTKNFNIQTSLNGTSWTTAATVSGNTAKITTSTIAAQTARYVKLNITTPTQGSDATARIYELEVKGRTGAFGGSWSTPLDQTVATDPDGSGNVVVTFESGRQARFGRNANGTYTSPLGQSVSLVRGTSNWTLRDSSGEKRIFDNLGNLTSIVNAAGQTQTLTYTAGQATKITDGASGRSLYLTWVDGKVAQVTTDAPSAGAAPSTWRYTYDGNNLVQACNPLNACTSYLSAPSSHYRSVVLDDNPVAYWPMTETSGSSAANLTATKPGELNATYSKVTLNQAGALQGTSDRAGTFTGANSSAMMLPDNLLTSTMAFTVELWFKAASGSTGVLYGEQNTTLGTTPKRWSPALYVGTDGKLHGRAWATGGTQTVSAARVDNGTWHHAAIAVNLDRQDIYLDGVRIGGFTGFQVYRSDLSKATIGNGYTNSYAGGSTGYLPFTGQIDDVAVYRHPLGELQVAGHYAARTASARLSDVTQSTGYVSTHLTYNPNSGRLATIRDNDGATWTLTQPVLATGVHRVALSSEDRDSVTYTYDAVHGDRLSQRSTDAGTESWEYDANGFAFKYIDANSRDKYFFRDARGNVVDETVNQSLVTRWKSYGYYLNTADPLDPRNDKLIWQSGTRTGWDKDPRNRIRYDLDTAGRTTTVTYPTPAGPPTSPTEKVSFTTGTEAALGGGVMPAGLPRTTTNKLGGVTTNSYNSKGDLLRVINPIGLTSDYGYDLLGRRISRTDSAAIGGATVTYGTWTTEFDPLSRVTQETAPGVVNPVTAATNTQQTRYTYSVPGGQLEQKVIADITGGDPARTWTYHYDAAGRRTEETSPDGATEKRVWNTAGDVAQITKANGLVLDYRYDDNRRLLETVASGTGVDPMDPGSTHLVVESRAYDPAGQLASMTDAMGRETAYTYYNDGQKETAKRVRRDAEGEIVSATELEHYEYDFGGNISRVTQAGGVVSDYDYDDAGLLNRETLDAAGVARTTVRSFAADGSTVTERSTNGYTFAAGLTSEQPYLSSAGGSLVDNAGYRYADGSAAMTYKFTFPADTATAQISLEVRNQYLIQFSPDNKTWTEKKRETNNVRTGENRVQWFSNITSDVAQSKTLYVKIGDSQPADGWGGALSRVAVEFERTGQKGTKTSYAYDTNGNLTTTTVDNSGSTPATLVATNQIDPRGLVTKTTDPAGITTVNTYDALGHLSTTTGAARTVWTDGVRTDGVTPVTTYGRNTFGDVTQLKDATGAVTTSAYDAMGRATAVTLPAYSPAPGTTIVPTTRTTYATDGQPLTTTDPLGHTTTNEYDPYGRLASITGADPDGDGPKPPPVERYTYDRVGERLTTKDATDAVTSATYDDLGRQITSTVGDRQTGTFFITRLGRTDAGLLSSTTTPLGHQTRYEYNKAAEQTAEIDPTGVRRETRYDGLGRVVAEITGGTRATSYQYDAAGRQVAQADHTVSGGVLSAALRQTAAAYDQDSRPTVVTSAAGRITKYGYGPGPDPTSVTETAATGTDVSVSLGYDAMNRRTRMTDGNNNTTDYLYNSWGARVATREPGPEAEAQRTWIEIYDAAGQPIAEQTPDGISRSRRYDGLGRIVEETGGGAGVQTATRYVDYDALGRPVEIGGPGAARTYQYDDRGLLRSATDGGVTTEYGYNDDGELTSRTDPSGTGAFAYDDAGRPKTIDDPLTSQQAKYTYTSATGDLAKITYGAGAPARTYQYDSLGRPATETVTAPVGGTTFSTSYAYDDDDLVTSRTVTGVAGAGIRSFGYDGLGRLTSSTGPDDVKVTYGYDGASNRTTETSPKGTRTYNYNSRNQLVTATGGGEADLANTWSAGGNLLTASLGEAVTTYRYDGFDKPVQVQQPGTTINYTYDSLGRLAERNGIAVRYADLTNNPVRVPTSTGEAALFRDPVGNPLSEQQTGPARTLAVDPIHGDTLAALDTSTGSVVASRSYEPYGEVAASNGELATGYQGGWTDPATGQVNALARWYEPAQAGFTTRDPLTLTPDPTSQSNRYAYANGSPATYDDPSGHCPICAVPLGELAAYALGALVAYAAVDYWAKSGAAENAIRSLYAIGNASVTAMLDGMHAAGTSAVDTLQALYNAFPTDLRVVSIAAPVLGYTPIVVVAPAAGTAAGTYADSVPATTPTVEPVAIPSMGETLGNIPIATTIALLPAGQFVQNTATVATPAALRIPSIVVAEADASQAANAAVATGGLIDGTKTAAAAAILAAVVGSGGGNGPQCDSEEEAARKIVEEMAQTVADQGTAVLDLDITPAQWERINEPDNFWRIWWARGHIVHQQTADRLRDEYGDRFDYNRNKGPDFFDNLTQKWIELTTPGEVAGHKRKGRDKKLPGYDPKYSTCAYATYKWPKQGE